jgi:methionyl-tRNA formyltransferase
MVIREPRKFDEQFKEELRSIEADVFVVAAYGQILPKDVISIPHMGTINIHPSLLPKYRGASPIQNAILCGDSKTGVSFIKMDEEVDHGPIILQFESDINPEDTFESLAERLFEEAAGKIVEAINSNESIPQDDEKATFTKILTRESGHLNLDNLEIGNLKLDIERAVRAFYPWPGVWFRSVLSNREVVIKLLPNNQKTKYPNSPFLIQVEGKKPMSYKDFKNGYEKGGEILERISLISNLPN